MKKFLVMCLFLLFPAVVLPADLPSLIPVVSKPVTKDKAIDLVKNGGSELRVPREELVKGLAYVIARQGGHDTGADNPLTQEEVILALKESSVVPCDFSKGEATVYGFRREDHSKMDGFSRNSRPGEQCLSYKGAKIISLACMNPVLDNKPSKPAVVVVKPVVLPEKKAPLAKVEVTPPPDTEWKTVYVTRISDGVVYVPQQVVASGGVSMSGCWNCSGYGYGGGLSQGGGLIYCQSGPIQQNTVVVPVGGNGGHWNQERPRSHPPHYNPPTIPVGGNGGGWHQVHPQPIPQPPPPSFVNTRPPVVYYQNPGSSVGTWPVAPVPSYTPPPSMVGTWPSAAPQNSGVRTQPFTGGQNSGVVTQQPTGGGQTTVRTR